MSRIKKKGLLLLVCVLIIIQFIQPAHNKSGQVLATDLMGIYKVQDSLRSVLQNACYDCHSNNTNYPWYSNIQPLSWIMENHINNGKEELNFSEFGTYTTRKQVSKLKAIAHQIKDNEMPLSSYRLMHQTARLTKKDKALIQQWMSRVADSLSSDH